MGFAEAAATLGLKHDPWSTTAFLVAGKATPAPPVGPALGQFGVNIAMFVKDRPSTRLFTPPPKGILKGGYHPKVTQMCRSKRL